jgi:NTE family protein
MKEPHVALEAKVKTRMAIACQGGGAETAFTAGAVQALFEAGIDKEFEIVSLGGTSGGAVCASLIWYALQSGEQPVWQRLLDFWTETNRPKSMQEQSAMLSSGRPARMSRFRAVRRANVC